MVILIVARRTSNDSIHTMCYWFFSKHLYILNDLGIVNHFYFKKQSATLSLYRRLLKIFKLTNTQQFKLDFHKPIDFILIYVNQIILIILI